MKIFGNYYKNGYQWKNTEYFLTGKPDQDVSDTDYAQGKFLKNGQKTHCQEGQLLKDYIKAVKILNKSGNFPNIFYLTGAIINDSSVLPQAPSPRNVKQYIEDLITPYSLNKHYKCYRSANAYHTNINEKISTKETVTVLSAITISGGSNYTYFPYIVEIEAI